MTIQNIGRLRLRGPVATKQPSLQQCDTVPAESVSLDGSRAAFPDFSSLLDTEGPAFGLSEKLTQASDAWVEQNLSLADPREQNVMKGFSRYLTRQNVLQRQPDWKPYEWASQATELWPDEQLGARSPLDPPEKATEKERTRATEAACEKTGMILRMLDGYLGQGVVEDSVRAFLDSAANGQPAGLDAFYQTLASKAKGGPPVPTSDEFKAWFSQIGHPIIRTNLQTTADGTAMKIRQSGFSVYDDQKIGNQDARWTVPVKVKYKDSQGIKEISALLRPTTEELKLPSEGKVEWAYPNGGGFGLFRTALEGEELAAITRDAAKLTGAERTALMCNQWRLVRHGEAEIGEFYDLLLASKDVIDPGFLYVALIELGTHRFHVRPEDQPAYLRLAAEILGPTARREGLELTEGLDRNAVRNRRFMAELLHDAGDPEARRVAQAWSEEYLRTGEEPTWGTGLIADNPKLRDKVWNKVKEELAQGRQPAEELNRLVYLDSARLLRFALDKNSGLNPETREKVLLDVAYLSENKATVLEALERNPQAYTNSQALLSALSLTFRDDVEAILQRPDLEPGVKQALEKVLNRGSGRTLKNLSNDIHDYLQKREAERPSAGWNIV